MNKFVACLLTILLCLTVLLFAEEPPKKYWVFFKDKQYEAARGATNIELMKAAKETISARALKRRAKVRSDANLLDEHDWPVRQSYLQALKKMGHEPLVISKWLNAVSVWLNAEDASQIAQLSFVKKVQPVAQAVNEPLPDAPTPAQERLQKPGVHTLDYGLSFTQNDLINAPAVHDLGITGKNVWIGMMDSGFKHDDHEVFQNIHIIAERDFINHDDVTENEAGQDSTSQHDHGTQTLATIGGFQEGKLIGPAFNAAFLLAKTEIIPVEIPQEEDNWVAGIEWLENQGVDVVSSSLGYLDFYTPADMDGNTAVTTRAADLAASRGVVVVNSAGNERNNPGWQIIIAPADGDSVIAVGAVDAQNNLASFSSIGPSADGRIKPDVVAMGVGVLSVLRPSSRVYSPTSYQNVNGTSFSCPLTAGVAALVLSAHPNLTPMEVRDALRLTADRAANPDNQFGWGLIDAYQAVLFHGPAFSNSPVVSVNTNQHLEISIKVASKFGVATDGVTLTYAISGENFYQSITMSKGQEAHHFFATIPEPWGTNTIRFYFTVVDSANVTVRHPFNAPDSTFSFSNSVTAVEPKTELPQSFLLAQNYPNPFNPTTTIFYDLPVESAVTLTIYNVRGQKIRTLIENRTTAAGRQRVAWDGQDDFGKPVSSGIYFYSLQVNDFRDTKKMLLIR